MTFGEKIGPSETVIPEQRFYSCFGCKYFNHYMIQSGQYPRYETVCTKMNWDGTVLEDGELCLRNYQLGDKRETPECCPYLKSTMRDDKLDKIL